MFCEVNYQIDKNCDVLVKLAKNKLEKSMNVQKETILTPNKTLGCAGRELWDYKDLLYFLAWRDFEMCCNKQLFGLSRFFSHDHLFYDFRYAGLDLKFLVCK